MYTTNSYMKKISIYLCAVLLGCSTADETTSPTLSIVPVASPVVESFRGLHTVSEDVVWLSGTGGTFMRTTDGGNHWDHGSFMDSVDFRDIYAFDANRAVMISAGIPAVIYKTEDGGENWSLKYKNDDPRVFFDAVDFWDNFNGLAFSDSFEGRFFMLKTQDGGDTWEQLLSAPEAEEGEGGFAASGTHMIFHGSTEVWMGITTGRVLYSDDRGITWTSSETPLVNRESGSAGIFSMATDGTLVLAVGGDYLKPDDLAGNSAIYQDGKWMPPTKVPSGFRSGVALIPSTEMAITTGTNGTDISFDQGLTWTKIDSTGYHAISFGGSKTSGWMSGGNGKVAKIKILEE